MRSKGRQETRKLSATFEQYSSSTKTDRQDCHQPSCSRILAVVHFSALHSISWILAAVLLESARRSASLTEETITWVDLGGAAIKARLQEEKAKHAPTSNVDQQIIRPRTEETNLSIVARRLGLTVRSRLLSRSHRPRSHPPVK